MPSQICAWHPPCISTWLLCMQGECGLDGVAASALLQLQSWLPALRAMTGAQEELMRHHIDCILNHMMQKIDEWHTRWSLPNCSLTNCGRSSILRTPWSACPLRRGGLLVEVVPAWKAASEVELRFVLPAWQLMPARGDEFDDLDSSIQRCASLSGKKMVALGGFAGRKGPLNLVFTSTCLH